MSMTLWIHKCHENGWKGEVNLEFLIGTFDDPNDPTAKSLFHDPK